MMPNSFPPQNPSDTEEIEFQRLYGPWATVTPTDVTTLLGDFPGPWWIAGGWALDAHTNTHRPHDDIDVAIFRTDLPALQRVLADRLHIWSAADGALRPLNATHPTLMDGATQVWIRESATTPWLLDVLLNPGTPSAWINRRDESRTAPLTEVTWTAEDGVRYLDPEIVLMFKAKQNRPKDRRDLERTWPTLNHRQRETLATYLRAHYPGHEWESYIS